MTESIEQRKRRLAEEANRRRQSSDNSYVAPYVGVSIGNGAVDYGSNDSGSCGDAGGGGVSGGSCD